MWLSTVLHTRFGGGGPAPAVSAAAPVERPVTLAAPAARPAAKPATAASGNALSAPMPGVIMDISVKPGDKVSAGQQLVRAGSDENEKCHPFAERGHDRQR